jgi:hypothetical protein
MEIQRKLQISEKQSMKSFKEEDEEKVKLRKAMAYQG